MVYTCSNPEFSAGKEGSLGDEINVIFSTMFFFERHVLSQMLNVWPMVNVGKYTIH